MKKISILLLLTSLLFGCQQEIDDYFYKETETYVDSDVMTLLREQPEKYSKFIELLEDYEIDTLLASGKTYTFFAPNNEAMEANLTRDTAIFGNDKLVEFLVTESYINIKQIKTHTKVQTQGLKFADIVATGDTSHTYDGVNVKSGSPLANNGRFYEIDELAVPKPNLYEYIDATNDFYSAYIDSQDSSYLDKELSTPVGYEDGKTIYNPEVWSIINLFEYDYFPVSEEFRDYNATMILFTQEQYDASLDVVKDEFGYGDISDISEQWQNDVLMPELISTSMFSNKVSYSTFLSGRARNIVGDSVDVNPENIDPQSYDCSNGLVYNYIDFQIPEPLYKRVDTIAGVSLITPKGAGLFAWADTSIVRVPDQTFSPTKQSESKSVSGDNLLVEMGKEYDGEFYFIYKHRNIFPGKYALRCRLNVTGVTGKYSLYVNGKLIPIDIGDGPEDELDLFEMKQGVYSPVDRQFYPYSGPNGSSPYAQFDVFINKDVIPEYGDVEVKLEYVGAGKNKNCGLALDFISLEYISQ